MSRLPLFAKREALLEVNWLPDGSNLMLYAGGIRGEFYLGNSLRMDLQPSLVAMSQGYHLRVQHMAGDRYQLIYGRPGLSKPKAVRRGLKESCESIFIRPLELYYKDETHARAVIPLKLYAEGVRCNTTRGLRNFRFEHIRSIHPVPQSFLSQAPALRLRWTRSRIEIQEVPLP